MYRFVLGAVLLLLACPHRSTAQTRTLQGYVTDARSGEVLTGAHVATVPGQYGTTTNEHGFFSLRVPADTVVVSFSYIGYHRLLRTFTGATARPVTVALEQAAAVLDSVEVIATRPAARIVHQVQMSAHRIGIAEVQALPALLGEADVLKTLQLMPGVQSGSEGSTGLYVRGGGPDQNMILLDGAPLYNVSHLFGFASAFNTDALGDVTLIKGGFPARYGGRLSSVLDLHTREGNANEFEGQGAVGLLASSLTVEGPLRRGTTTFLLSARRTYFDVLTRPLQWVLTDGKGSAGYYFYDVNAKGSHTVSHKDRLFVSFYAGHDRFATRFRDDEGDDLPGTTRFGLGWRNTMTTLRWNRVLGARLFASTSLLFSRFRYTISEGREGQQRIGHRVFDTRYEARLGSGIRDAGVRLDLDYLPHHAHRVRLGAALTHHRFTPGTESFFESGDPDDPATPDSSLTRSTVKPALEAVLYAEDEVTLTDRIAVHGGLHLSGFAVDGTTYTSAQPRLSGRVLLSQQWSVKASYAAMRQYIHLLTNSSLGLATDLWVPSTAHLRPQSSWQVALGLAHTTAQGTYQLTLEGYYKPMQGLVAYREGASVLGANQRWESQTATGHGRSYGGELLLRKQRGRTTGWIGYTLSRTTRRFAQLNGGRAFPYRYDRRHDMSVALMRALKRRTVSVTWVYGTGQAISVPAAQYVEDGAVIDVYTARNGGRAPAYHRLDLSVHTPRREGAAELVFSVYNLYSRRNPFFLFSNMRTRFDTRRGFYDHVREIKQISLFPIIPSLSYRFTF